MNTYIDADRQTMDQSNVTSAHVCLQELSPSDQPVCVLSPSLFRAFGFFWRLRALYHYAQVGLLFSRHPWTVFPTFSSGGDVCSSWNAEVVPTAQGTCTPAPLSGNCPCHPQSIILWLPWGSEQLDLNLTLLFPDPQTAVFNSRIGAGKQSSPVSAAPAHGKAAWWQGAG